MSTILVMGYELPSMSNGAIEARSYRTLQFVEPLLAEGHQVCLVVSHQDNQMDVSQSLTSALSYHRVNLQAYGWRELFRPLLRRFNPDSILAITFNSCLRATRLPTSIPIWMDIYGDKLAEIQIAQFTQNTNRGYRTMLHHVMWVLKGGDVYSTCGTPQKYALVGQLGMASRLNRQTLGYEFVHAVLPGASTKVSLHRQGQPLRGTLVPENSFIVLWCGGYNVWADIETLFQALTQAMELDPRIVFVSVGAGVKFAQNDTYEHFLTKIKASSFRDRFYMLGWRPASEVPDYYRQADVGINLDALHYETVLGTRTRLVEMMSYGLPVITSLGCELSHIIQTRSLGLTFPIGDGEMLSAHIVTLANNPELRKGVADKSQLFVSQELSFSETTRAFQEWIRQPYHAPDRLRKKTSFDLRDAEYFLRSKARRLLWRLWALERGE
ncbi:MAG: glycosyltransferase family 4 protein [Chloroflexi bacterium]|nr:glycosyltransferase family 4 protein [Chloroflexota bacterium]